MTTLSRFIFFCYWAVSLRVFPVVQSISILTIVHYTFYIKCIYKRINESSYIDLKDESKNKVKVSLYQAVKGRRVVRR
jgi:hypothetical protein